MMNILVKRRFQYSTIAIIEMLKAEKEPVKLINSLPGTIDQNKVQCLKCGDTIESLYTDHRISCSCGKCIIDGGRTSLKREKCTGRYKELSKHFI